MDKVAQRSPAVVQAVDRQPVILGGGPPSYSEFCLQEATENANEIGVADAHVAHTFTGIYLELPARTSFLWVTP